MELPNIFKKPDDNPECLWSLIIDKSWVEAGIWYVDGVKNEVVVLAKGTAATWQEGDLESLVAASDSSMSSAASEIPEDVKEPEKVVFGLHASWIEDGDIKGEKLDILKKISGELELKPAGFVVINEAIAHYLKAQEGAPINAILTGLAEDSIDLTLVQEGKIVGSSEVGKSMDLGQDVAEGLAKMPPLPQYPARILLYNHRVADLEEARQSLIDANWEKLGITFLHAPRVDILPEDATLAAISLAGGAEIAQAVSVRFESRDGEPAGVVIPAIALPVAEVESEEPSQEIIPERDENLSPPIEETIEQAAIEPEKELQEVAPEDLGFSSAPAFTPPPVEPEPVPVHPTSQNPSKFAFLGALFAPFKKLRLPALNLGFAKKGGVFGVTGILLILAFLGVGLAYWFLPKAEVTIFVAPKRIEKTLEFTVSPDISTADIEKKLIPGKIQEAKVSGEKTTQTSGTKAVGDKAKGTVTIYRAAKTSVTLPAGTALTGPSGLKFVLDEQVKIASGSGLANPSEQDAKVTADKLGAEYNLASNTTFIVGTYAEGDLQAENKNSFSGGSSREVSAVGDKDITGLEASLTTELLQKGIEELKSKLSPTDTLVESSVLLQKDVKTFSAKSGDEASTLKLKIEGKVTALVAPIEGVNQLVRASLEKEVPDGYTLKDDQIEVKYKTPTPTPTPASSKKTTTKETVKPASKTYVAEVGANLLPKLNPTDIAKKISGKYPERAKEFLATLPGYTRAEIHFNIKFPGRLNVLPRVPSNITLDVRAEQ
ncbi:MAG: baseplate J/gp47 family protein [bacterium]|nr:baseplate J/gp47 family protein [bacterium]